MVTAYLERYATPAGLAGSARDRRSPRCASAVARRPPAASRPRACSSVRRATSQRPRRRPRRRHRHRGGPRPAARAERGHASSTLDGEVVDGDLRPDLRARPAPRGLRRHRRRRRRAHPRAVLHRASPASSTSCRCSTTSSCCSAGRSASRRTPPSARPSSPPAVRDALAGRQAALMANHGSVAIGAIARQGGRATRCCWSGWPRCTTARQRARHPARAHRANSRPSCVEQAAASQLRNHPGEPGGHEDRHRRRARPRHPRHRHRVRSPRAPTASSSRRSGSPRPAPPAAPPSS